VEERKMSLEVGDIVRILPTANAEKYRNTPTGLPGWRVDMVRDIGKKGIIMKFLNKGHVVVKVSGSDWAWIWMSEDLELVVNKWRKGECR